MIRTCMFSSSLTNGTFFYIPGTAWSYLLLLFVYVQLSRVAVVGLLFPFLRYFGYGFEWKEATILIWSGLRGAVALALSLSVKASQFFFICFGFNDIFAISYLKYLISINYH